MGHATERISGKLNETEAPAAAIIWNDTGEEPDLAAQDMEEDIRTVTADIADSGKRADVFFADMLESTRSHVQILLNEGRVCKGSKLIKPNYKVKAGDVFQVVLPRPVPLEAEPENIPLNIIYEDEDVIVLNKPRGMVVHPAPGHNTGTLVNALLFHCKNLSGINGVIRPGDEAHVSLSKQIQDKTARRTYLCIVRGNVKADNGLIETRMDRDKNDRKRMAVVTEGGREAITGYEVLERFGRFTVVRCSLKTGRTHQIRLHMEYLGYPLVGDPKYSPMKTPFSIKGQALHSQPLPEDMQKIMTRLHNGQF